jgi:hypothetical protein
MGSIKAANLRRKRNRPPKGEPFIWLSRELMESDAWRTAKIHTIRLVMRLMLEWMAHAGTENGRLACTYDDLVAFGIGRRLINRAIAGAVERGLVYRTEQGGLSAGDVKKPSRYGLGWLPGHDGSAAPNRWKDYRVPYQVDIKSSSPVVHWGRQKKMAETRERKPPLVHQGCTGKLQNGEPGKMNLEKKCKLPPGWKIGKADDGHVRPLKPGMKRPWTGVPIVGGLGDEEEQTAFRQLQEWKRARGEGV